MTTLRGAAFWAVDALQGGRVRAHLNDIADLMENRDGGTRRQRLLTAQLAHATSRVPFYRYLRGATTLDEFPVVDKAMIRENAPDMLADGFDANKLHVASTSGSTGTPFRIYQDARKRRRVQADAIYWGRRAGYELGLPLYHLKIWSDRNRISRLTQLLRNVIPIDVATMGEAELLDLVGRMAAHRQRVGVISYSSTLEALARAMETRPQQMGKGPRRSPRVASIIGQSEALPAEVRASLAQGLGCEPVGRYGLEELGIIGQQAREPDGSYFLNVATQAVEVLQEDSDKPAPPGELGRLVVTDLFNLAQPMIRYDTGDLGAYALSETGDVDLRRLALIEGRKLDRVYDVDDKPLASMIMYKVWWRYPEIHQYQLIQNGRGNYVLRLNVAEGFTRTEDVVRDFRECVGQSADVAVELTGENLILSSGKRRSVVSSYAPAGMEKDVTR